MSFLKTRFPSPFFYLSIPSFSNPLSSDSTPFKSMCKGLFGLDYRAQVGGPLGCKSSYLLLLLLLP